MWTVTLTCESYPWMASVNHEWQIFWFGFRRSPNSRNGFYFDGLFVLAVQWLTPLRLPSNLCFRPFFVGFFLLPPEAFRSALFAASVVQEQSDVFCFASPPTTRIIIKSLIWPRSSTFRASSPSAGQDWCFACDGPSGAESTSFAQNRKYAWIFYETIIIRRWTQTQCSGRRYA